jgi:hypothetical protein
VIERELRAGLDLAVATEPPLAFDPDALVARAQRENRRRKSLAGVGVATAVIAVAAVAVPTALNVDTAPAKVTAANALTTTPVPPPGQWPPSGVHQRAFTVDELHTFTQTWSQRAEVDLPHVLPGATGVTAQPWGGEAEGDISPGQGYLDTFVGFTVKGERTAVFIQIEEPGYHRSTPAADCAQETGTRCTTTWQGGGALVEEATVPTKADQALRPVTVRQYRADGSVVSVTTYNYDPTAATTSAPKATVPLTVAQLTVLATDPVFAFGTG